jgi:hypothetical protein
MNGFEKSLNTKADHTFELAAWPPRHATERDIAAAVIRAERLRTNHVARIGRQMGQTISSLWRRPGRLLPAAAR